MSSKFGLCTLLKQDFLDNLIRVKKRHTVSSLSVFYWLQFALWVPFGNTLHSILSASFQAFRKEHNFDYDHDSIVEEYVHGDLSMQH